MSAAPAAENQCVIKYIHLKPTAEPAVLHDVRDFEYSQTTIRHSTFVELHDEAFKNCPAGFRCIEPIALRHEVLWNLGLRLLRDERGNFVPERDQLLHALEADEYRLLVWDDGGAMISLCVDIVPVATDGGLPPSIGPLLL
jgi:hypothetical protein